MSQCFVDIIWVSFLFMCLVMKSMCSTPSSATAFYHKGSRTHTLQSVLMSATYVSFSSCQLSSEGEFQRLSRCILENWSFLKVYLTFDLSFHFRCVATDYLCFNIKFNQMFMWDIENCAFMHL